MVFDKEEHKQIVLTLIDKAQFPGSLVEQIAEFKAAVVSAKIEPLWVPEHIIKNDTP